MKKILSTILFVVMAVSFVLGTAISVSADTGINNTIKGGLKEQNTTKAPDRGEIELLKECGVEQMPKSSSYLEKNEHMYMATESGDGAFAYKKPNEKAGKVSNVYRGVSVQVMAVEGDWACVSFYNSDNDERAGWVWLDYLSSEYPGETVRFGKTDAEDGDVFVGMQPEIEWSKFNFVDTKTKYTTIEEPWCDYPCTALIFDYQVTSRNGVKQAYGERDVYINSGEGWQYVGSFEVEDDFTPVRCEICFEEPTVVKAIATIPVGASAENFIFRQAVEYIYYRVEQ